MFATDEFAFQRRDHGFGPAKTQFEMPLRMSNRRIAGLNDQLPQGVEQWILPSRSTQFTLMGLHHMYSCFFPGLLAQVPGTAEDDSWPQYLQTYLPECLAI